MRTATSRTTASPAARPARSRCLPSRGVPLSWGRLAAERTGDYDPARTDAAAGNASGASDVSDVFDGAPETASAGASGATGRGLAGIPVRDLVDELARRGDTAVLADLPDAGLRELVDQATRLEGVAALLTAGATFALARSGALRAEGASSPGRWLQATTGRSLRDAQRLARLGNQLGDVPGTAAGLADGSVGVQQADEVVRAVRRGSLGDPAEVEASLLPVAREAGPEALRREVRRRTQRVESDAIQRDERRARALRSASITVDQGGMTRLYAQFDPTAGERVRAALDAFDVPDGKDVPEELRRSAGQRLADSLEEVARRILASPETPIVGGRVPQLAVVVDLETLDTDLRTVDAAGVVSAPAPDDPAWAELSTGRTDWGQQLSPQAVRQIACDAGINRVVVAGASEPLDVGRTTRIWPTAVRNALAAIDGGCRGPGCDRPFGWCEIHHIVHWSDGGPTCIENAAPSCKHCHDLVHVDGWTVEMDPTTRIATWTSPAGLVVVTHPRGREALLAGVPPDGPTSGEPPGDPPPGEPPREPPPEPPSMPF